jgi:uncharacterized protein YcbX
MSAQNTVAALNIHPLKSGRAISLRAAQLASDGLVGDRRFMLVDPDGTAITQRTMQALAQVGATLAEDGLDLSFNGEILPVRFSGGADKAARLSVRIWSSTVDAACADDATNAVLNRWFGRPVRLVFMDALAERRVGETWAGSAVSVGFADGFPVLVTTTASLDAVNRTLVAKGQPPVRMDRFRTNILISNDVAWEEDLWEAIEIGGIRLDLVKPCERCIMTTQDQITGERTGGNPIEALAVERMSADRRVPGVLFGWNAVPRGEGLLAVGDDVRILSRRSEGWPMKRRTTATGS